jgi:flagellar protein FlgJ
VRRRVKEELMAGGVTGIGSDFGFYSGDISGAARRAKEAEGEGLFADLLRKASGEEAAPPSVSSKPVVDKSGELYEQCQALETFLIKNLLSSMRNTVQKSGLVEEGFAGRMYEDMLYDEYASVYAKNAGFGFAELAYLELTGQRGKVITR